MQRSEWQGADYTNALRDSRFALKTRANGSVPPRRPMHRRKDRVRSLAVRFVATDSTPRSLTARAFHSTLNATRRDPRPAIQGCAVAVRSLNVYPPMFCSVTFT